MAGAAGDHTLTVLPADDEGAFLSPGTTPTQVARARMLEGMLSVLCAHDLAQHRFGGINPGLEIVAGRSREKCTGSKCSNAEGDNPFLHFESFPEVMESLS